MNTTKTRKKKKPARPVTDVLLELAYYLHTTRVTGPREKPRPAPRSI